MFGKVLGIIFIILFFFSGCKKSETTYELPKEIFNAVYGTWLMEGERVPWKLDPKEKSIQINDEKSYELVFDPIGMQVKALDEEIPLGYFQFNEINGISWVGIWKERVVRLYAQKLE